MAYVQYTRPSQSYRAPREPTPEERARQEAERRKKERRARIRTAISISAAIAINVVIAGIVFFYFGGLTSALVAGAVGFTVIYLGFYARIKAGSFYDFGVEYFNIRRDGWLKSMFFLPAYVVELSVFLIGVGIFYLGKGVVVLTVRAFRFNFLAGFAVAYVIFGVFVATFHATFPGILRTPTVPPESPMQSQLDEVARLSQVQLMPDQPIGGQVILHPYVLENRLFIQAFDNASTSQIEIPQKAYTRFHERFLIDLGFNVDIDYTKRLLQKAEVLQDIVTTQEVFTDKSTILIADGALQDINYQQIFQDRLVFRSSSLDTELIVNNLNALYESPPLAPGNTTIINGIPGSPEELANIGLDDAQWNDWDGIQETWRNVINGHNYMESTQRSATEALEALSYTANVLIIVAHSDGQTIYFPDGTSLTTSDLESLREEIQQNRPIVALFACETARVTNGLAPFTQALIDLGAKAVVAPVSEIGARSTSEFLDRLLQNSAESIPPIEAIWEAIQDTNVTGLENWIGYRMESDSTESEGVG